MHRTRFLQALCLSALALGCGEPDDDGGCTPGVAMECAVGLVCGTDTRTCRPPSAADVVFPPRDQVCGEPSPDVHTPCRTDTPSLTDEARTAEAPSGADPITMTFVVRTLSLPEATPDSDGDGPLRSMATGFNLDGLDSQHGSTAAEPTCEEAPPDYEGLYDDGLVGVDNALQGLVGTLEGFLDEADCPSSTTEGCLDATLQAQIDEGALLLLVELRGVDDLVYDTEVRVQMALGTPRAALVLGDDGRLAPGQTFDTEMLLGGEVTGDIFGGRLRFLTDTLPLTIDAGGFVLPLVIHGVELRFDVDATRLANGSIGGFLRAEEVITAASAIAPWLEAALRSIVEGAADYEPSAGDPAACSSVSVGLSASATTANPR